MSEIKGYATPVLLGMIMDDHHPKSLRGIPINQYNSYLWDLRILATNQTHEREYVRDMPNVPLDRVC